MKNKTISSKAGSQGPQDVNELLSNKLDLRNSKTYLNLAKSFAGECQAKERYQYIVYGAKQQGYKYMAELIEKVIYNEFNHARMFYTHLQRSDEKQIENIDIASGYPFKQKWDLVENLRIASEDERNEATLIYPEYAKIAAEEGYADIAKLYEDIIQVETCHQKLFEQLYNQTKKGTLYKKKAAVKWKCADCGYEATGKEAWKICPLCLAKQGSVMIQIEDEQ